MLTTANIFMLQLFGLHLQKKLNETLYVGYMHGWVDIFFWMPYWPQTLFSGLCYMPTKMVEQFGE